MEGTEGTEVEGGGLGLAAHCQQLLPGMLDEIALTKIVPRLPWKDLCSLESVSQVWRHGVQSREAYDARVRQRALESFVLVRYRPNDFKSEPYHALGLSSIIDGLYFELPPLPVCQRGIPELWECVTLDGRIYVLGGEQLVYVLDLASGGPRQWRQCASMLQEKMSFSCAALDGKLYVWELSVWGIHNVCVSEVYDPKGDTWSLIEPLPLRQSECLSTAVRQALAARGLVYAMLDPIIFLSQSIPILTTGIGEELYVISALPDFSKITLDSDASCEFPLSADVYHPGKDEWRVEKFDPRNDDSHDSIDPLNAVLFIADGNLYRMRMMDGSISVLDVNTRRWMLRHRSLFAEVEFYDDIMEFITEVKAVGDELLAICAGHSQVWMFQSEGFGGKNINLKWNTSKLCPSNLNPDSPYRIPLHLYPIQL